MGLAVAIAIADCDPPPGHPTSCRSIGVTPGSGGWLGSIGDEYSWTCCNQNFSCSSGGVNYGYRFQKVVGGYGNGTGHCFDYDNIVNVYPDPAVCCDQPVITDPTNPNNQ